MLSTRIESCTVSTDATPPKATMPDTFPAAQALRDFIAEDTFPCVGAKAALNQGSITIACAGDLRSDRCDEELTRQLQVFAGEITHDSVFQTFAVIFEHTPALSESAFETALWQRLQAIHDIDAQLHRWDTEVSNDPRSPDFSMSVGGRAFYVIGLHPGASRTARRFSDAALVFNLHSQFQRLKENGRYEKMQVAISERDIALCGSKNPILARHGETSAAPQYSGRIVEAHWVCPFRAH